MTMVPILVMLLVFISISVIVAKSNSLWKPKRARLFILVFSLVGIASYLGVTFFVKDTAQVASEQMLKAEIQNNASMVEALELRNFAVLKNVEVKYSETLHPTEQKLELLRDDTTYDIPVYIEWNDSTEDEIIATYYETPLYLNRINISDKINPPKLALKDGELLLFNEVATVEVHSFRSTSQTMSYMLDLQEFFRDDLSELVGLRILHLNVPRHFTIIDHDGWIE
ncbi:hypothetical protein [Solibacillus daqui]|uniref:hypothetical protein n=1 Tax=Solibacillus daqui TaxID=2912187 RepID=UPI0023664B85|nr:hypothetical protein [Solibacillus daqui]